MLAGSRVSSPEDPDRSQYLRYESILLTNYPTQNDRPTDLALVRTELANERTLLAYGRTSLMLVGTGVSLAKILVVSTGLVIAGWGLVGCGAAVGLIGIYRFVAMKRRLRN